MFDTMACTSPERPSTAGATLLDGTNIVVFDFDQTLTTKMVSTEKMFQQNIFGTRDRKFLLNQMMTQIKERLEYNIVVITSNEFYDKVFDAIKEQLEFSVDAVFHAAVGKKDELFSTDKPPVLVVDDDPHNLRPFPDTVPVQGPGGLQKEEMDSILRKLSVKRGMTQPLLSHVPSPPPSPPRSEDDGGTTRTLFGFLPQKSLRL